VGISGEVCALSTNKIRPRPVLRYYGGKWRLAPWLISLFPPHRIYVEPFGGGASVLMRKERTYAEVYNDLNDEIVNVFRVLQDPDMANALCRQLMLTPYARNELERAYVPSLNPIEAARRTIVRSFMGFGSTALETPRGFRSRASVWGHTGFRRSSYRSGTIPAHDWANYPVQIQNFIERLAGVVIECKPAAEVMADHDRADTLHYVDPPYLQQTRSSPRHEYRHEMTEQDHIDLANQLHRLKGMVVLSGYPSSLYDDELYRNWTRLERIHMADGARKRTEVVWLNPAAAENTHHSTLFTETSEVLRT
jgi:DNA adenine methylase